MIWYDLVLDDDGKNTKWFGNHYYYIFRFMTHNNGLLTPNHLECNFLPGIVDSFRFESAQ